HYFAALDSTLKRTCDRTIQSRHLNVSTQGRLAERDRDLADEILAVALEEGVLADPNKAEQITARRLRVAGFTFPAQPNSSARVDAGRDRYLQRSIGQNPARAVTVGTWRSDNNASASACP